jgi:hypothetical protein
MPWTICLILLILWLLGLVIGYATGYFIHIPLFFAIIAILTQIVTDFRDDGFGHTRLRRLKRQWIGRFGKISPKLVTRPGEKGSPSIISSQAYREEQLQ